jgi:hypothetical protein
MGYFDAYETEMFGGDVPAEDRLLFVVRKYEHLSLLINNRKFRLGRLALRTSAGRFNFHLVLIQFARLGITEFFFELKFMLF